MASSCATIHARSVVPRSPHDVAHGVAMDRREQRDQPLAIEPRIQRHVDPHDEDRDDVHHLVAEVERPSGTALAAKPSTCADDRVHHFRLRVGRAA